MKTCEGGNAFNGLWFIFIGWFLQSAAASSVAQTTMQEQLRSVTADQLTNRRYALGHMKVVT